MDQKLRRISATGCSNWQGVVFITPHKVLLCIRPSRVLTFEQAFFFHHNEGNNKAINSCCHKAWWQTWITVYQEITMRKLWSEPDKTDLRLAKVLKIPAFLIFWISRNACERESVLLWSSLVYVDSCVFVWLLLVCERRFIVRVCGYKPVSLVCIERTEGNPCEPWKLVSRRDRSTLLSLSLTHSCTQPWLFQ